MQGEVVTTVAEAAASETSMVEPLQRVLERPMLIGDASAPDSAKREVTVIADKSLPFDLVRKVMATCTATTYGKISLAVLQR